MNPSKSFGAETMLEGDDFYLEFLDDEKVRRPGIEEPLLEIISYSARTNTLVVKVPGHSVNHSGIRGMRNDEYIPTSFMVFQYLKERKGNSVRAKLLLQWNARKPHND